MVTPLDRVNQIAFKLGLERPGDFKPLAQTRVRGRGLGRTTHMILWALADVVLGKPVCFMAPTREQAAEIVYKARDYAREIGLDPALIRRPVPYGVISNSSQWPPGCKVFKDHNLNFGGGFVREPQTSTSRGSQDGYSVACPWCRRDIEYIMDPERPIDQGRVIEMDCSQCHQPVVVHFSRVRIVLEAWRNEDG